MTDHPRDASGRYAVGERPLTQKQESFALAYFETGNAAEAYRRSYDVDVNAKDEWIYVEACQLLDNPTVWERVEAYREQARSLSIYNVLAAADEYEEARQLALATKSASAAVSAVNGKVKLFGLEAPTRSRHEVTGKDGGPIEVETPRERVARRIAGIAARSGSGADTGGPD